MLTPSRRPVWFAIAPLVVGGCLDASHGTQRTDTHDTTSAAPDTTVATTPDTVVATMPDATLVPVEVASEPLANCSNGEVELATSTSRLSVDAFVPHGDGWIAFLTNTSEPGSGAVFIDAQGRISRFESYKLNAGSLMRVGAGYLLVSPSGVQRIEIGADGEMVTHAMFYIGWGTTLSVAPNATGGARMLFYNPENHSVDDLRIHVTDLTFDASTPYGFSMQDGTLGADLSAELGYNRFDYLRYAVSGDYVRIVGSADPSDQGWRTRLIKIDPAAIGSQRPVAWHLLENTTWNETPYLFGISALAPDAERMLVVRKTSQEGPPEAHVELYPSHGAASNAVGSLGPGTPVVIDHATIGVTMDQSVRFFDAGDLAPLGSLTFTGGYAAAIAVNGHRAGVLSMTEGPGELRLLLRCTVLAR